MKMVLKKSYTEKTMNDLEGEKNRIETFIKLKPIIRQKKKKKGWAANGNKIKETDVWKKQERLRVTPRCRLPTWKL